MNDRNYLNQIIDLIRKTGERCIVVDDENSPYVVMTFEEYEKLISRERQDRTQEKQAGDLTSQELLDKINQEIALWKSKEKKDLLSDGANIPQIIHLENIEKPENKFSPEMEGGLIEKERYFIESLD